MRLKSLVTIGVFAGCAIAASPRVLGHNLSIGVVVGTNLTNDFQRQLFLVPVSSRQTQLPLEPDWKRIFTP